MHVLFPLLQSFLTMVIAHWYIAIGLQVGYNIKIPWPLGLPGRPNTSGCMQPMGSSCGYDPSRTESDILPFSLYKEAEGSGAFAACHVLPPGHQLQRPAAECTAAHYRQAPRALLEEVSSRGRGGAAANQDAAGQGWRGEDTGWRALARAAPDG